MRKAFLFCSVALLIFASCKKNDASNAPYTCTCRYAYLRGVYYVADTTVSTTYATGTLSTAATYYCDNAQSALVADTFVHNVECYIHQ